MTAQHASLSSLKSWLDSHRDEMQESYFKFLSFKSISTDPEYAPELNRCAAWVEEQLTSYGLDVEIWETEGHPVIFAQHCKAGPEKPTVLVYNHYDVQPVDPLEEWETPPFEPTVRNGEVYARGAQDNKGQCFYVMQAVRALLEQSQQLPVNLKLIIEGEEEIGSVHLPKILEEKKEALKADHVVIADVGIPDVDTPAVTLSVRGMVTMDVSLRGSAGDLHSGMLGGVVYNPNHALVELLAKLRNADGSIAVPGFYDGVHDWTDEEKQQIAFDFDEKKFETTFKAKAVGGEKAFSPLESCWIRPTLEINGLSGGYSGPGFKTVIPAVASAKVSCRLVPNQNPAHVGNAVKQYLLDNAPEGMELKVDLHSGMGEPAMTTADSSTARAFAQSYEEVFGSPCQRILSGGSIPIVANLVEASGGQMILVGLGLDDDAIHAPNEHFGLQRLDKGFLMFARALELLGQSNSQR